jgi:hypothetical protein
MRALSFWIRPADDHEFLAVQRLGFAPQAAVSRRIGRIDRLRDDAFKTELAGVRQDEPAVACVVAVELKAGLFAISGSSSALRGAVTCGASVGRGLAGASLIRKPRSRLLGRVETHKETLVE